MYRRTKRFCAALLSLFAFLTFQSVFVSTEAAAAPSTAVIASNFQSELGSQGDWQPDSAVTQLMYDANDDIWQGTFLIPAGNWEYKIALDGSWNENYGLHAAPGGANIPISLSADTYVKFYYDSRTHWVTDNINSIIVTVPGSFQSKIGAAGDWDPSCLRSWLQDPDGDGIYSLTASLPAGSYEAKAAINEGWDVNYGQGGIQNGPNIPFTLSEPGTAVFTYNPTTHVLTVEPSETLPDPPSDLQIGWGNLQWPPSITVQAGVTSNNTYGQVFISEYTALPGPLELLRAELGYGPVGTDPSGNQWNWTDAAYNCDAGNNDEYTSTFTVNLPGSYNYCFRYSYNGSSPVYADLTGPSTATDPLNELGVMTVAAPPDTTPPSLTAPDDMTVEATASNGAFVTFGAAATDDVGPITITYSKDPGTLFPIGCTTVTCTAADGAGNTASADFKVTVVDTTPPALCLPDDITVTATSAGGAVVNFIVSATDSVGVDSLTASPQSGTLFPIGSTIVNCTAGDLAGNATHGTFTVTVLSVNARIDIMPDDASNKIVLKGNGAVPVAVLGSATFDVKKINPETVAFAGASPFHSSKLSDINKDGFPDIIFHFRICNTNLTFRDRTASLSGQTIDGYYFSGSDTVQVK